MPFIVSLPAARDRSSNTLIGTVNYTGGRAVTAAVRVDRLSFHQRTTPTGQMRLTGTHLEMTERSDLVAHSLRAQLNCSYTAEQKQCNRATNLKYGRISLMAVF